MLETKSNSTKKSHNAGASENEHCSLESSESQADTDREATTRENIRLVNEDTVSQASINLCHVTDVSLVDNYV